MNRLVLSLLLLLSVNSFSLAQSQKSSSSTSIQQAHANNSNGNYYQNPVFDHDFPDPNLVRSPDGYFYGYSTNTNWRKEGLEGPYTTPVLRSKDLVHWVFVGDAFDKKPDWKKGGIWAPDVTYYKHKYILFYAFSTWGDPNPAIGVAVSQKPEGPFTDLGKLFYSKEIGVDNSIDANLVIDHGKPYLVWGSFRGIYGIALSDDATKIAGKKFQIAGNQFEGSYIYKRGKYFYYFGSSGSCCEGVKSTYHLRVGRSVSLKGPYIDKDGKSLLEGGGTLILKADEGDKGFVGPGHNGDIETDDAGQTWMVYHAIYKTGSKPENAGAGRPMLLDKIEWIDGWPVFHGQQPSDTLQPGPVFR